jgi:hypothetical protein
MITRKKSVIAAVGAAVAATAVPAFLFAGAGTAHAETHVHPITDALGVTVFIDSFGVPPSSGWCTYTAIPQPGGIGVPVYNLPFYLQENASHQLWFPGVQTGTKWHVTVDCPSGVDSWPVEVVY